MRTADGDLVLGVAVPDVVIVDCPFPCGRDQPDRGMCGSPSPGTTDLNTLMPISSGSESGTN